MSVRDADPWNPRERLKFLLSAKGLTGRLAGFTVTSFGMGAARPVWYVRVAGMRVYLALGRPFAGLTWSFLPALFPPRGKLVAFAAGGILANALVCALALVLWTSLPWGGAVWVTVAAVNGGLAVTSAIPFQMRVGKAPMRTDGMLIARAFRSATFAGPAPLVIQSERYFRALWAAIGDDLMLIVHHLAAAEALASLGEFERAAQLLTEGGGAQVSAPSPLSSWRLRPGSLPGALANVTPKRRVAGTPGGASSGSNVGRCTNGAAFGSQRQSESPGNHQGSRPVKSRYGGSLRQNRLDVQRLWSR